MGEDHPGAQGLGKMKMPARLAVVALLVGSAPPANAQRDETADRAAIHALLMAYGSTLDARDFQGFGKLFGENGVYVTGSGTEAKGPVAAETMRKIFAANALGFREPNAHIFFNELVRFDGPDHARATSMSFYVAPDEKNRPTPMLMASYEDELARENGRWIFARRVVKSVIPAPSQPK